MISLLLRRSRLGPGRRWKRDPGGMMGKDGYCFDVFEGSASLFQYLEERISEAYEMLSDKSDQGNEEGIKS